MSDQALYRFYTDDGRLLYVGIASNPARRFAQHAKSKEWWSEVRGISIEWYPSREAVEDAERRAISVEQPIHNVIGRRQVRKHATPAAKHRAITWLCSECAEPIEDGEGAAVVELTHIRRYETDFRVWQETNLPDGRGAIDVVTLMSMPEPAAWTLAHSWCGMTGFPDVYEIAIDEMRTYPQVLFWTLHIAEKGWLDSTDWSRFIQWWVPEVQK